MKRRYWIASLVILLCVSLGINAKVGIDALNSKPDPAQVNGLYQTCLSLMNGVAKGLDDYLQTGDEREKRVALYHSVQSSYNLQRVWEDISPDVVELYGETMPRVDQSVRSFNETIANYLMYDSLKGSDVSEKVRDLKGKVDALITDLKGTSLENEKSAEQVFKVTSQTVFR